jgi:hypothetical protein
MSNIENWINFADACYEMNDYGELKACLFMEADENDCKEWNITKEEWHKAIRKAIRMKREDI